MTTEDLVTAEEIISEASAVFDLLKAGRPDGAPVPYACILVGIRGCLVSGVGPEELLQFVSWALEVASEGRAQLAVTAHVRAESQS